MSFMKSVPEGLKWIECMHGIGGKIPQFAMFLRRIPSRMYWRKIKRTTYFNLILPNTGNELKVNMGNQYFEASFYFLFTQ